MQGPISLSEAASSQALSPRIPLPISLSRASGVVHAISSRVCISLRILKYASLFCSKTVELAPDSMCYNKSWHTHVIDVESILDAKKKLFRV